MDHPLPLYGLVGDDAEAGLHVAEKESGKTRALEVTALLVPEPILSISTSPAAIIRLIAKERPTISTTRSMLSLAMPRRKRRMPICAPY